MRRVNKLVSTKIMSTLYAIGVYVSIPCTRFVDISRYGEDWIVVFYQPSAKKEGMPTGGKIY